MDIASATFRNSPGNEVDAWAGSKLMPEIVQKVQYFAAEGLGDSWYYRVERLPAGGIFVKYDAALVHLNASGYVDEEMPCIMEAATPDAAIDGLNELLRPMGVVPKLHDYDSPYPLGA